MFRTGKYKKARGAGWNILPATPALAQKIEEKQEAKQEEEQVKSDRKKLFRAWQRF